MNIFIVPRFALLTRHGFVDPAILEQQGLSWTLTGLMKLHELTGQHTTPVLLLAVVAIGFFEWRVRSENKALMRVAALGTVATTLMIVFALMTISMLIAFELGAPPVLRMTRPWAVEQVSSMSKSLSALEQAKAKKDWSEVEKQAEAAANSLRVLSQGPALASLTRRHEAPSVEDLRAQLNLAHEELRAVQQASAAKGRHPARRSHADQRRASVPTDPARGRQVDGHQHAAGRVQLQHVFRGPHPGVCMFVFCDGSVKGVKSTVDLEPLTRLAVRNDGLPIIGDY